MILDTGAWIAKVAALDINNAQARSSVGEHYLDTVGVGGSIPPVPTSPLPAENRAAGVAACYPAEPLTHSSSTELEGCAIIRLLELYAQWFVPGEYQP